MELDYRLLPATLQIRFDPSELFPFDKHQISDSSFINFIALSSIVKSSEGKHFPKYPSRIFSRRGSTIVKLTSEILPNKNRNLLQRKYNRKTIFLRR